MKTITSQNPIIEEVSLDLGCKNMQLSYFFENVSKKPKGFISFFDKVILNDTKSIFIQAPEISNLMESQELKKVLWQKIKKDFID
jgi:6-pyruvoyl-tetrahydropterin synthase